MKLSSPSLSVESPARLPPPVRPGDRVGVAALSGLVDPKRLAAGVQALKDLDFEPVLAKNLECCWHVFAGEDRERLEGFHELAADPGIKAILFARGGHGVLRLLPHLDWDLLATHPRAYMGYSDLTPFLLEVVRRLGLVAFHGPMVAADLARGLEEQERESFLGSLAGDFPREIALPFWDRPASGPVEGPLLGGCLSLLTAVQGTPFCPDLRGSLLFWEEVAEPFYRLDRMLTHLRLSGSLREISGMLVGHVIWHRRETDSHLAWQRLMESSLGEASWPLASGVPAGHRGPNLTLPLGALCRLEPAVDRLLLGAGAGSNTGSNT